MNCWKTEIHQFYLKNKVYLSVSLIWMNGHLYNLLPKPLLVWLSLHLLARLNIINQLHSFHSINPGSWNFSVWCLLFYTTHNLTFSISTKSKLDEYKNNSYHCSTFPFSFILPLVTQSQHFHFGMTLQPYWLDRWFKLETLLNLPPNPRSLYYSLVQMFPSSEKSQRTFYHFWNLYFRCIWGLDY